MNFLVLDTETTTSNYGNPYDVNNKLVCISYWYQDTANTVPNSPESLSLIQEFVDSCDIIVGFHFKFDLHWLKKEGIVFNDKQIWDIQSAEFVKSHQTLKLSQNSLDQACERYGVTGKLKVVEEEYWSKGINTDEIPWEILSDYATQDAVCTKDVFLKQFPTITGPKRTLVYLMGQDMYGLQEMEENGMLVDIGKCSQKSEELETEIKTITTKLGRIYPDIPINFNSPEQLSAFLYGGTITQVVKVEDGFYKTGQKKGLPKLKNVEVGHQLPRLFEPIKGTALQKEGVYKTSEDVLLKLRGKYKPVVADLLRLSKLDKLNGTYYKGIPSLIDEMHWADHKIHGQLNQCVTVSGRLSSSKPNVQNFASELQDIFLSEYNG